MSQSCIQERTLALAGIFQAAALVKQLAKTGRVDEKFFLPSIESILKIEASSTLEIYTNPSNLTLGLNELIRLFTNNKLPKDAEIARYVFSLLHLEKKLARHPEMLTIIRQGIKRAKTQATHFSSTHENVMANLASLYTDTLSTFTFRVYVSGEPMYLNQTYVLNKIRALLLAGIRSAVLWQQVGGRRWQLLISRSSLIEAAQYWLKVPVLEITHH
jgi:high frequency lysogenization protein